MPKLKTHQAVAKRIRKTKNAKYLHRASGQDHFNARESGTTTRRKRRGKTMAPVLRRTLESALPY